MDNKIYVTEKIVDGNTNENYGYMVYEVDLDEVKDQAKHGYTTFSKLIGHFRSLQPFAGKMVINAGTLIVNAEYTLEDLKLELENLPNQL